MKKLNEWNKKDVAGAIVGLTICIGGFFIQRGYFKKSDNDHDIIDMDDNDDVDVNDVLEDESKTEE